MYKLTKGDKMIDKEYRDDHNYLSAINKFSNKDMLKLALYQEWVHRRYTKPTWHRTAGLAIASMVLTSIVLANNFDSNTKWFFIALSSSVLFVFALLYSFSIGTKKDENTEVAKLNAIRDAIEFLSK